MDDILSRAVDMLISQGPVCVVLSLAAYWLAKRDERKEQHSAESTAKMLQEMAAERAELLDTLNTERTDRVQILEWHVVECNSRHDSLQREMREMLKGMVREPSRERLH